MILANTVMLTHATCPDDALIDINTSSAKNSILPLLFASILHPGESYFLLGESVSLLDVQSVVDILELLGASVEITGGTLRVDTGDIRSTHINSILCSRTRYSILALGGLVSRCGIASVGQPGGCDLNRPINFHIGVLEKLGCEVEEANGSIYATRIRSPKYNIVLPYPSVGATLNAIFCATRCHTDDLTRSIRISNCAIEPEIDDVIEYLVKIGISVKRKWRDVEVTPSAITVPSAITHRPIFDRIEAGSYALAAAILGVRIRLNNAPIDLMAAVISVLLKLGCTIAREENALIIDGRNIEEQAAIRLCTEPYPGFPTDLQPILTVLCTRLNTCCVIQDTVMPERTRFVEELNRLGANIKAEGSEITIHHDIFSKNADGIVHVRATDLRGGMAVVLYALLNKRKCYIENFSFIRRGYSNVNSAINAFGGVVSEC